MPRSCVKKISQYRNGSGVSFFSRAQFSCCFSFSLWQMHICSCSLSEWRNSFAQPNRTLPKPLALISYFLCMIEIIYFFHRIQLYLLGCNIYLKGKHGAMNKYRVHENERIHRTAHFTTGNETHAQLSSAQCETIFIKRNTNGIETMRLMCCHLLWIKIINYRIKSSTAQKKLRHNSNSVRQNSAFTRRRLYMTTTTTATTTTTTMEANCAAWMWFCCSHLAFCFFRL